ncbi:MAG: DUF5610 domain-containing protein [Methylococcaceae bacterium]|nr:DUF5610 domain-containing protein [Methylococcaceae bacterium]
MNTQSIQVALSSSFYLTGRLNQAIRPQLAAVASAQSPAAKVENDKQTLTSNPNKVIEKQVFKGLDKTSGTDSKKEVDGNDSEFNPEKLARKIMKFVNQSYRQLQSEDPNFDKAKFFSQVKQGLETGFADAKDTLSKLGMSNAETQKGIDAAYANIQQALTKLESANQASSVDPAATATNPVAQLQGFSAQMNQSAEVQVVTKEGDIVKIKLSQSAATTQGSVNLQQNGQSATAFQLSSENSSNFSVSVQGNLNEDEQASLKKLLKEMDTVGQDFFKGNVKDAFEHTQKIGLDTGQIASFSLSLSSSKSIQAVAAYQQAATPDQQVDQGKIKQATDFFSQARDLLKTAQEALKPFENPLSVFDALFGGVNQVAASAEPKQIESTAALQQIIKPLGETVLATEPKVPVQA